LEVPMTTINVSIPDHMKLWIEQQANAGGYANASDYVCHLIRCDQERATKIAHLQALVTEGIESGVGRRSMDELKAAARGQARASNKPSR
jgi:antitoxin ParD1/3/4